MIHSIFRDDFVIFGGGLKWIFETINNAKLYNTFDDRIKEMFNNIDDYLYMKVIMLTFNMSKALPFKHIRKL